MTAKKPRQNRVLATAPTATRPRKYYSETQLCEVEDGKLDMISELFGLVHQYEKRCERYEQKIVLNDQRIKEQIRLEVVMHKRIELLEIEVKEYQETFAMVEKIVRDVIAPSLPDLAMRMLECGRKFQAQDASRKGSDKRHANSRKVKAAFQKWCIENKKNLPQ